MSKRTAKINVYLPTYHNVLIRLLAAKNDEAIAAVAKRILIPGIEEAASSSFRASNALYSALKKDELDPTLQQKLLEDLASIKDFQMTSLLGHEE